MTDLWGEFYSNNTVKKLEEKYEKDLVEHAIQRELQIHLDEVTFEQIEKHIKQQMEDEAKRK